MGSTQIGSWTPALSAPPPSTCSPTNSSPTIGISRDGASRALEGRCWVMWPPPCVSGALRSACCPFEAAMQPWLDCRAAITTLEAEAGSDIMMLRRHCARTAASKDNSAISQSLLFPLPCLCERRLTQQVSRDWSGGYSIPFLVDIEIWAVLCTNQPPGPNLHLLK